MCFLAELESLFNFIFLLIHDEFQTLVKGHILKSLLVLHSVLTFTNFSEFS